LINREERRKRTRERERERESKRERERKRDKTTGSRAEYDWRRSMKGENKDVDEKQSIQDANGKYGTHAHTTHTPMHSNSQRCRNVHTVAHITAQLWNIDCSIN
jgi:hypothetical protein